MPHEDKEMLLQLARKHVLQGDFAFTSGRASKSYFDGRMLTLSCEGLLLVGRMVWESIAELEIDAIGGPTLGADPIIAATMLTAAANGKNFNGFIVRGKEKDHGANKLVEGPLSFGSSVAIVDDVVTMGGSMFGAIQAAEKQGCKVKRVIALLDWQLGGSTDLLACGYDFQPFLVGDVSTGAISLAPERPL